MKNAYALLSVLCLAFGLVGCGGGGGGGGSSSSSVSTPPPPALTVTQISPANSSTTADPRNLQISVTFSDTVAQTQFANKSAKVGRLFASRGMTAQTLLGGSPVNLASLTLGQILSGKYALYTNYGGNKELAMIANHQFNSNSSGMSLDVTFASGQYMHFSRTEIKSTNVGQQNFLTLTDGTGTKIPVEYASGNGNQVTFQVLQTLNWDAKYNISISGVTSSDKTETMAAAFTSTFTTMKEPAAAITNVSPVGIQADPLNPILITPNFVVTNSDLSSVVTLDKVTLDTSGNEVLTPVTTTNTWDATNNQVVVTPSSDLDYLQKYKVTVASGANGLVGSMGTDTNVTLSKDYTWEFTTNQPAVELTAPTVTKASDASVPVLQVLTLSFNFRPDPSTVVSPNITLTDSSGNSIAFNTPTQIDATTFQITPTSPLDYSTEYTLTVTPNVISKDNASIFLAKSQTFSFTTVNRVLLAKSPDVGMRPEATAPIVLTFNFDLDQGNFTPNHQPTWDQPGNLVVEESADQNGPWTAVTGNATWNETNQTLTFTPTTQFQDNDWVQVTIGTGLMSADDQPIYTANGQPIIWEYQIANNQLDLVSFSPDGSSPAPVNSTISATFNYNLKASTVTQSALQIQGTYANGAACQPATTGNISLSGQTITFTPNGPLDSFCKYTITVDPSITGTNNEQQATNGTSSFNFTTDGLAVTNTWVNTTWNGYADVGTDIEVDFNHNIACCVTDNSIQVTPENDPYTYVPGTVYQSGNTLTFVPDNNLDYSTGYNVDVVSSGYDAVVGVDGETMLDDYQTSFVTEDLPLNVVDYGPTGLVNPNDTFWVQLDQPVNTYGFPGVSADASGTTLDVLNSTSGYTVSAQAPYPYLAYNTNYTINFEFDYADGTYFNQQWDVTTVTGTSSGTTGTTSSGATGSTAAPTVKAMSRPQANIDLAKSCRNNPDCVGQLKVYNNNDERLKIAAMKRESIMKNTNVKAAVLHAQIKAAHARRLMKRF